MARNENPPMKRGELFTWYTDDNGQQVDAAGAQHLEGKEWEFEDNDYAQYGVVPHRSGKQIVCKLTRNKSLVTLLPGQAAKWKADGATADVYGGQVDGVMDGTAGQAGGIVDEFLPASGAPPDSLFWLVVYGPAKSKTLAAAAIATGGYVGAAAGGTIAGIATLEGSLGRCLLGVAAAGADIMIHVRRML